MFKIKPKITEEWYLVFDQAAKEHWFHRFIHPEFQHCYAMKKSEAGLFWMIVNPSWSHVSVEYRLATTFPDPRDYVGEYARIVKYQAVIDPQGSCTQLNVLACVDIIKRFLGIRNWRIITPYQLYKYARFQNG